MVYLTCVSIRNARCLFGTKAPSFKWIKVRLVLYPLNLVPFKTPNLWEYFPQYWIKLSNLGGEDVRKRFSTPSGKTRGLAWNRSLHQHCIWKNLALVFTLIIILITILIRWFETWGVVWYEGLAHHHNHRHSHLNPYETILYLGWSLIWEPCPWPQLRLPLCPSSPLSASEIDTIG